MVNSEDTIKHMYVLGPDLHTITCKNGNYKINFGPE